MNGSGKCSCLFQYRNITDGKKAAGYGENGDGGNVKKQRLCLVGC
jgi:hypothetical protein